MRTKFNTSFYLDPQTITHALLDATDGYYWGVKSRRKLKQIVADQITDKGFDYYSNQDMDYTLSNTMAAIADRTGDYVDAKTAYTMALNYVTVLLDTE